MDKKFVSEAMLRHRVKKQAGDDWVNPQVLELSAETVGVACALTGINDPVGALEELVQDALHRWARLQAVEYDLDARKERSL